MLCCPRTWPCLWPYTDNALLSLEKILDRYDFKMSCQFWEEDTGVSQIIL